MYELRYIGPEADCSYQRTFEKAEDIFLHVAESIAEDFEDCEIDFDDPNIQDIITALESGTYTELIEHVNAFLYPMNCDYFEVCTASVTKEPTGDFEARMSKVFASVEKARQSYFIENGVEYLEIEDERV